MGDIRYISSEVEKLVNDFVEHIIDDYYKKTVERMTHIPSWEVMAKDGTVFRFSKEYFKSDDKEV